MHDSNRATPEPFATLPLRHCAHVAAGAGERAISRTTERRSVAPFGDSREVQFASHQEPDRPGQGVAKSPRRHLQPANQEPAYFPGKTAPVTEHKKHYRTLQAGLIPWGFGLAGRLVCPAG